MIKDLNQYRNDNGYLNIPELGICKRGTILDNYIALYISFKLSQKVKAFIPTESLNVLKEKTNTKVTRGMHQIDGNEYFCKMPSGFRPYSPIMESIASTVGNYLGGNYLDYDIISKDNKPYASISKYFLSQNSLFQTISELSPNCGKLFSNPDLEEILTLLDLFNINKSNRTIILKSFIETFIIDALLQQFDHHTLNIGFVKDGNSLLMTPTFDNEYWFPNHISLHNLKKHCNNEETFNMMKYYQFLRKRKNNYQPILFGYTIYDFIIAIITNKIDRLNVPEEIKIIISSIDKDIISNIISFNPFSIINLIEYEEVKNNEVYSLLLSQCQKEFIRKLELKDSVL